MTDSIEQCQKYYERTYQNLLNTGLSTETALEECGHGYLDGKPQKKGSHYERSKAFWSCNIWAGASSDCYNTEAVLLSLGRTFNFGAADEELIKRIGRAAPDCMMQAIRHSQLFLKPESKSWLQVLDVADSMPERYGKFLETCNYLCETVNSLEQTIIEQQKPLEDLTIFEILVYGSIYTYRALAHTDIMSIDPSDQHSIDELQALSDIVNQMLAWKLQTRPENDLKLSERFLAQSLKRHLMSFLYPTNGSSVVASKNLKHFDNLAQAILELNDFQSRVLQVFCYDDDYSYAFEGQELLLKQIDDENEPEWEQNGRKIGPLHLYWISRTIIECEKLGVLDQQFGTAENNPYNREAYLKAMQLSLQLDEVYGVGEKLELKKGQPTNTFKLLHCVELMTAFYKVDHIAAYQSFYREAGDWVHALRATAENGMKIGRVRYPLTWMEPEEKARNIKAWTVSDEYPEGNIEDARAILDFWSNDLAVIAKKLKRPGVHPLIPELYEKPILNLGQYGIQLPWLMATQNNSTAVINNLRRIGRNRSERKEETDRIESRLGELFESRGFSVVVSYQPEIKENQDPGEVDLICYKDEHLFILEVKSGYRRISL